MTRATTPRFRGQGWVVEGHEIQAAVADGHAQPEEEQGPGHADPTGEAGEQDPADEQDRRHEDVGVDLKS
jgi:hypothetical protein